MAEKDEGSNAEEVAVIRKHNEEDSGRVVEEHFCRSERDIDGG